MFEVLTTLAGVVILADFVIPLVVDTVSGIF